ncbi:hypothetical protein HHK36_010571 [Tetracentron sinense]|uniref:U-box domain-containing protein n=1 Tax=Tetracentron sinense TaxID=13715 RepID=A0A834ZEK1_TETSI|nr:hypothetical protein HHK36_010571 [Tetracentron sinense]
MVSEEMDLVPAKRMENGLNSQMVFQDESLQFNCGAPQRSVGDPERKTREVSGFVDGKMFSVEQGRWSSNEQHQHERVSHYENAVTIAESNMYYPQFLQGQEGSALGQKEIGGENGCGFSGRKDIPFSGESGKSLREILSDPLTGVLMDDAMILPCGHSFGSGGMQHVIRVKACYTCPQSVSENSVTPNLSLRAAVQAFRDEELHSYRASKRRRFEQDKGSYGDPFPVDFSRGRGVQFPFAVMDQKACYTCPQSVSENSVTPNLSLRAAVQAFRDEELHSYRASKRRRFEQDKGSYGDPFPVDFSRGRGVQFPFAVMDQGNKRTPQRFVGREAVVTTQCLNGWYEVKTLDNAESVKLQYRSLAKVPDTASFKTVSSKTKPNWFEIHGLQNGQ